MSIERIESPSLLKARQDHTERYLLAAKVIKTISAKSVVDCAAGIGYGSNLMAIKNPAVMVRSIEKSAKAANIYSETYSLSRIEYINIDYKDLPISGYKCDLFVSFEFIEHIWDSEIFLYKISTGAKYLILSTPNELVRPHQQAPVNKHHVKHFRPLELQYKLQRHGFKIIKEFCQRCGSQPQILEGLNGKFMIFLAKNQSI